MNAIMPMNVPQPVKLTIADYELLDRAGAFRSYAKSELIDGVIVGMAAQYRAHSWTKNEIADRLKAALRSAGSELSVQIEATVEMPPSNLPEPDIVVTDAPRGDRYMPAGSVKLIVEIADSTAAFDLGAKAVLYARHAIPEYWVVELPAACVHSFSRPEGDGYQDYRVVLFGQALISATMPDVTIETTDLS